MSINHIHSASRHAGGEGSGAATLQRLSHLTPCLSSVLLLPACYSRMLMLLQPQPIHSALPPPSLPAHLARRAAGLHHQRAHGARLGPALGARAEGDAVRAWLGHVHAAVAQAHHGERLRALQQQQQQRLRARKELFWGCGERQTPYPTPPHPHSGSARTAQCLHPEGTTMRCIPDTQAWCGAV